MHLLRRNKLTILVAGGILSLVLVTSASGVLTSNSGGSVAAVKMLRETDGTGFSSPSWFPVLSEVVDITIPEDDAPDVLLARFTAESSCTSPTGSGNCLMRIVVIPAGGSPDQLAPKSGDDFVFDEVSVDGSEAHAMERSSVRLPAGRYFVRADRKVTSVNVNFTLDDIHFTVERID